MRGCDGAAGTGTATKTEADLGSSQRPAPPQRIPPQLMIKTAKAITDGEMVVAVDGRLIRGRTADAGCKIKHLARPKAVC